MDNKSSICFLVLACIGLIQAYEFKVTHRVSFDISIGGREEGSIIIGVFGETTPITARNFLVLATTGLSGKSYAGTPFHRVIKNFMVQGGDIIYHNGTGSYSIYGTSFPDENFECKHYGPGFVSMANYGPNTNGCQFFIMTAPAPWLDGKHVVFGKVLEGMDVVQKIENVPTDDQAKPQEEIMITNSRMLEIPDGENITVRDADEKKAEL